MVWTPFLHTLIDIPLSWQHYFQLCLTFNQLVHTTGNSTLELSPSQSHSFLLALNLLFNLGTLETSHYFFVITVLQRDTDSGPTVETFYMLDRENSITWWQTSNLKENRKKNNNFQTLRTASHSSLVLNCSANLLFPLDQRKCSTSSNAVKNEKGLENGHV